MATETLEERVELVEQELAQLKRQLQVVMPAPPLPWWEKIASTFAKSEHYDEAMRLGVHIANHRAPKTIVYN